MPPDTEQLPAHIRRPRGALAFAVTLVASLSLVACGDLEERKAKYMERALAYEQQGELEKARVNLRNVLKMDREDVPARLVIARVLEKLQRWPNAAKHYQVVLQLEPDNADARLGLANIYLLAGETEPASALAEEVLAGDPKQPRAHLVRAGARARSGDLIGARRDVDRALELDSGNIEATLLGARLHVQANEVEAAVALLREAVEHHPDEIETRMMLARVLSVHGDDEAAISELERVLAGRPQNLDARVALAGLYARTGRLDDGESVLRASIEQDEDSAMAMVTWLWTHRGSESARPEIARLDRAHPDKLGLRLRLADFSLRSDDIAQATAIYEAIAQVDRTGRDGVEARSRLARIALGEQRPEAAARLAEEVLEQDRHHRDALIVRARLAFAKGDAAGAIVDLRTVLGDHPEALEALRLRARAHVLDDALELAREDLLRVVQGSPRDVESRLMLLELMDRLPSDDDANATLRSRVIEELEQIADELIAAQPHDPAGFLIRGSAALARADPQGAREAVGSALRLDPTSSDGSRLLASVRKLEAERARIRAEALMQAPLAATRVQDQLALARALVEAGELDRANQQLLLARASAPDDLEVLEALARVGVARGQWADALAAASRIAELDPDQALGHRLVGLIQRQHGELAASVEALERAFEQSDGDPDALAALVEAYVANGQAERAESALREALRGQPGEARVANLLGQVLIVEQRFEDAEEVLARAALADPGWDVPHRNIARVREAMGDTEGALEAYAVGLQSARSRFSLTAGLAALYERLGRPEKAIALYEELLRQTPASDGVANNLAMLLASHRTDAASLRRALLLARRFERSVHPAYLDTLGWVHLKLGNIDDSIAILRRVVDAAPSEAVFNYHLGKAYEARGELGAARAHLEAALGSNAAFEGLEDARLTLEALDDTS